MSDSTIEPTPARPEAQPAPPRRLRPPLGPVAGAGLGLLALLIALALLGWLGLSSRQDEMFVIGLPPSLAGGHWFGTDAAGRDVLALVLGGLGVTLMLGAGASLVALALGLTWGALAGYVGGAAGAAMTRFVEVLAAMPLLFFVIGFLLVARSSDGLANLLWLCFAVGVSESLALARMAQAHTATLRRQPFIDAAQAAGARPGQIVTRHIAPNLIEPALIGATRAAPAIVLSESLLSFIGLGAAAPFASLGRLIAEAAAEGAPWALIAPTSALFALLLALQVLGKERKP
jgi:oligopeptide transport system permease protein